MKKVTILILASVKYWHADWLKNNRAPRAARFLEQIVEVVSQTIFMLGSLRNEDGNGNNNATKQLRYWSKDHK